MCLWFIWRICLHSEMCGGVMWIIYLLQPFSWYLSCRRCYVVQFSYAQFWAQFQKNQYESILFQSGTLHSTCPLFGNSLMCSYHPKIRNNPWFIVLGYRPIRRSQDNISSYIKRHYWQMCQYMCYEHNLKWNITPMFAKLHRRMLRYFFV